MRALCFISIAICLIDWSTARGDEVALAKQFADQIRPSLVEFCGDCHAPDDEDDPVGFLKSNVASDIISQRGIWASVAEQLHNRTMPPGDKQQPSEQQRLEAASWIQSYLESTACSQGEFAGAPVPRRLNRDQYTFAIEDLTGVAFDFVETFPADGGGGEGFDNNGETLFLPPLLMEKYLEVAQQVLDTVMVTEIVDMTFGIRNTGSEKQLELVRVIDQQEAQPFTFSPGSRASTLVVIPSDNDFRLELIGQSSESKPSPIELSIDGIEVDVLSVDSSPKTPSPTAKLNLSRGVHRIDLQLPKSGGAASIKAVRLVQSVRDRKTRERNQAATDRLLATGKEWIGRDDRKAAQEVLRAFATQAWRRSVTGDETKRLMQLYDRGAERGESLQLALKLPLKAILVSPNFLFVTETEHASEGIHRITDVELASRLALFLWHSIPDAELLADAEANRLHRADVLQRHVRRMIKDKRSKRFAQAFAGQWLGTVAVGRTVIPDTNHYQPVYNTDLVIDMRRQVGETMHFMLRNDRPVSEWLDCDYVVVNKRLAKFYQFDTVPDSNEVFEQIDPKSPERPGVFGLGAVHILTSYSRRTSPVLRGGWVLETIFGVHLPAPPPDAGNLKGGEKEVKNQTVRQRLEQHRKNPTCAACHDLIDPIGFAMENFDVIGRWRVKEEGDKKIDAKGKLPSGETFVGPQEMRAVLMKRKDDFAKQFTRQMLGYALGRSLEDADSCTVSALTDQLKENEYKMESLVMGIVESVPFQHRQGTQPAGTANEAK